jgi:PAS domain S-box-containing protein
MRHDPSNRAAARVARRRRGRSGTLLLLHARPGSAADEAIARAAAARSVGWSVEPIGGPDALLDRNLPDATVVGIGPGVHAGEPIQIARRLRRAGVRAPLIFFAESESLLDATRAELLRDPFAVDRYELVRVDDPRLLSDGLARVARLLEGGPRPEAVPAAPRPTASAPGVSDHFLSSILSQANDAIMSTDQQGVLLTWNVAAERLFGYPSDQAIGQPIGMLDEPHGRPRAADAEVGMRAMAERVLNTGTPEQAEASCRRADGSRVTVDVSIAPLRSPDAQLLGLSVIARDNSDQRRAAEALREANRQKDEFLAIMSHELRTPLTSILGYTDMLLRGLGGPLGAKTTRYVGNVRTAGDRLLELVNGLLDFTRLEAGREQIEARPISLQEVVRTAVERAELIARAKGIRLELRLDRDADRVMADPGKLQHVLASYLTNAIKFTPPEGSVCVEVAADPEAANEVRVQVSDSGIGLRNDQLARVWERFYQGDASLTRPYGGMGLGLSIARHLIHLHGGRVGVDSPGPGHGSTFWLSLPRASAAP